MLFEDQFRFLLAISACHSISIFPDIFPEEDFKSVPSSLLATNGRKLKRKRHGEDFFLNFASSPMLLILLPMFGESAAPEIYIFEKLEGTYTSKTPVSSRRLPIDTNFAMYM